MAISDLRNYYPHYYRYSCIVEVQDDVAETLEAPRKAESARKRKIRRHGGEISVEHMMERGGLMFEAAFFYTSSDELLEKKYTSQVLHNAVALLPERQSRRILAYFFLDRSISEIAAAENVTVQCVWQSIRRGLRNLEKILRNSSWGI